MELLFQSTFLYMVPLMIVALAGIYAERSGIINIALEGIMVMGSFSCALFTRSIQESGIFNSVPQLSIILGMIIAMAVGALFSLLLSYASVKWKSDQTITGTALNLIAPAIVLFIAVALFTQEKVTLVKDSATWCMLWVSDEMYHAEGFFPSLIRIFFDKAYITTYIGVLIFVVMSIVLYKTKFGLRLRACGEHPQAADSVGINVHKMRYLGVLISGALGGLGGYIYSLTIDNGSTTGSVAGFGFLAMAIMIFGNWNAIRVAFVSFLFGMLKCVSSMYGSIDINGDGRFFLKELSEKIPFFNSNLYNMLPYLVTLIVLAFTSKKMRAPKAEGIPYDKGQR